MIKHIPPSGVIAPSHLRPVIDKAYKLPENKTMPKIIMTPAHKILGS